MEKCANSTGRFENCADPLQTHSAGDLELQNMRPTQEFCGQENASSQLTTCLTDLNQCYHCYTKDGFRHGLCYKIESLYLSPEMIFGIVSTILFISLCWNIYCCISKYSSGFCKIRKRQSSLSQMQDNPIYGNIIYSPSSTTLTIGGDPQPASSMMDQHRVNSESQDCYANLTVKAPRSQSGQVSSLTQYPEAVYLVEQPDSEMKDEGNPDTVTTVSDLYASVQNQRTKTVQTANSGEGYANHL